MKNLRYSLALLGILVSLGLTAQPEIGLQLYSLRDQMPKDVAGTLDKIKAMGIRELEGGGTYNLSQPDFQNMLKERGLSMISIGAEFDDLAKDPMAVVNAAKAWNVRYVVCFWIPHAGDNFTLEDTKKSVEVFNKAGRVLKENGVTLCYHPHGFEFRPYKNGTLFDYLVTNTDSKALSFEMDVFWVKHPGQDPVALLEKYPARFELVHLKDRRMGTQGNQSGHAEDDSNVVLGTGDVGIEKFMKAARKTGIRHYFIEDESSQSLTQIPQSIQFLRSITY